MRRDSVIRARNIGIGIAIGLGTGISLFAATDNPAFIGAGVVIGLPIVLAMNQADEELTQRSRRLLLGTLGVGIVVLVGLVITLRLMR